MTIVRKLSPTGDFTFGRGKNNYLTEDKAVAQSIQTRLKSFIGDCFFALNEGIDWFNLLGGKDLIALRLAVSNTILQTENVKSIREINFDVDKDRGLTITYIANTDYGDVQGELTQGV